MRRRDFLALAASAALSTAVRTADLPRDVRITRVAVFDPFAEASAIDVFQGDMNHFGFEGIGTEAAWAAANNLLVAPTTGARSSATTCSSTPAAPCRTSTAPNTTP